MTLGFGWLVSSRLGRHLDRFHAFDRKFPGAIARRHGRAGGVTTQIELPFLFFRVVAAQAILRHKRMDNRIERLIKIRSVRIVGPSHACKTRQKP